MPGRFCDHQFGLDVIVGDRFGRVVMVGDRLREVARRAPPALRCAIGGTLAQPWWGWWLPTIHTVECGPSITSLLSKRFVLLDLGGLVWGGGGWSLGVEVYDLGLEVWG